jgi:RimJ/RimL family protein N-acetyltransferase
MSSQLQPHLKGELIELRPLRREDWNGVFAVASDPLIWEQHPESDRYKEEVFKTFFEGALESRGAFAVFDAKTQQIIGSTRFHGYNPQKSEIEIGWTFLARKYWGGPYNLEMKRLMLSHAFRFVENVVFFVGVDNIRSQRAIEKIGAIKHGTAERRYGDRPPSRNIIYLIKKSPQTEQWLNGGLNVKPSGACHSHSKPFPSKPLSQALPEIRKSRISP